MSSTAESFAGYLESMVELSELLENTHFTCVFRTYLHNTSQTPGGGHYLLTLDVSDLICSIQLQITDLGIEPSLSSICQCSDQFIDYGNECGIQFTDLIWSE